jgi:hypothetical protein
MASTCGCVPSWCLATTVGQRAHLMAASLLMVLKSGPTGFWTLGPYSAHRMVTATRTGSTSAGQHCMHLDQAAAGWLIMPEVALAGAWALGARPKATNDAEWASLLCEAARLDALRPVCSPALALSPPCGLGMPYTVPGLSSTKLLFLTYVRHKRDVNPCCASSGQAAPCRMATHLAYLGLGYENIGFHSGTHLATFDLLWVCWHCHTTIIKPNHRLALVHARCVTVTEQDLDFNVRAVSIALCLAIKKVDNSYIRRAGHKRWNVFLTRPRTVCSRAASCSTVV